MVTTWLQLEHGACTPGGERPQGPEEPNKKRFKKSLLQNSKYISLFA